MTKYDIWLKETGSGVFGPGVEPPNQFSRPTHERFKADLCELIACYPNGKPEDVDQHALDIVWEKFNWRRSEAAAIRDADIPAGTLNGVTRPLLELDRLRFFEGGYTQYVAYVCGQGVEPGFYWCWRRDRFHLHRDYFVDQQGNIRAVKLPMLQACVGSLNPKLTAKVAEIVRSDQIEKVPDRSSEVHPDDARVDGDEAAKEYVNSLKRYEPSANTASLTEANGSTSSVRKLTPHQERQVVSRYRGGETVHRLAIDFGVARTTIDRCLVRAGAKVKAAPKSNARWQ